MLQNNKNVKSRTQYRKVGKSRKSTFLFNFVIGTNTKSTKNKRFFVSVILKICKNTINLIQNYVKILKMKRSKIITCFPRSTYLLLPWFIYMHTYIIYTNTYILFSELQNSNKVHLNFQFLLFHKKLKQLEDLKKKLEDFCSYDCIGVSWANPKVFIFEFEYMIIFFIYFMLIMQKITIKH